MTDAASGIMVRRMTPSPLLSASSGAMSNSLAFASRLARVGLLALVAACTPTGHSGASQRPSSTQATPADSNAGPRAESTLPAASVAPHAALPQTPPVPPPSPDFRIEDERNSIDVFRSVAPSTVFVTQTRVVVDYWAGTTAEVPAGSGSGFVWDNQGHIVTNFHVIQGAQQLTVTLHDHRQFEAKVVGAEPRKDIAVLKLVKAPADLKAISVREKLLPLDVGQKTLAIGNPFGLDQTLTTGIVSALGREVQGIGGVTIRDMIQTDAAINPGNSGGPLIDSSGYLIGMNTMIYSRSGSSAGIGFAVPVQFIKRVVPQLIEFGKTKQVGLGVRIDPTQRLEQRLGVKGVIVLEVIPNTPAAETGLTGLQRTREGLRLGHVIVAINEFKITDYDDLYNTLDRFNPGDRVKVKVAGETAERVVEMNLVEIP
jgi:S1-C subfamily serine protease